MKNKRRSKVNIPMCAAAVILCLTLVSIHLTSGLYARYSTTSSGEDSARVAKFDVSAEISEDATISNANRSGEYTISVHNNSEVAIEYRMILRFTILPKGISAALDGEDGSVLENAIKFETKNTLAPGESKTNHKLIFTVAEGEWTDISYGMSGIEDSTALPFTVEIIAVQID